MLSPERCLACHGEVQTRIQQGKGLLRKLFGGGGPERVQLVRRASNPRFHELISRFFERTGVPHVLNTSFNDSEPIVCTPAHTIATFRSTGIDALFMGDIYLTSEA